MELLTDETGAESDMLNANRNVAHHAENVGGPAPSAERSAPASAMPVAPGFDWKKYAPWIVGFLVLLLIVWALSRKGHHGPSAGVAA